MTPAEVLSALQTAIATRVEIRITLGPSIGYGMALGLDGHELRWRPRGGGLERIALRDVTSVVVIGTAATITCARCPATRESRAGSRAAEAIELEVAGWVVRRLGNGSKLLCPVCNRRSAAQESSR